MHMRKEECDLEECDLVTHECVPLFTTATMDLPKQSISKDEGTLTDILPYSCTKFISDVLNSREVTACFIKKQLEELSVSKFLQCVLEPI